MRVQKQLLSALSLLLLLVLAAGCGQQVAPVAYGFSPPLDQLAWGMNQQEALSSLGLTEEQVIMEFSKESQATKIMLKEKREFFGAPAQLVLWVTDGFQFEREVPEQIKKAYQDSYLDEIRLCYDTDVDPEAVTSALKKSLGEPNGTTAYGGLLWQSPARMGDIKEKNLLDAYQTYWQWEAQRAGETALAMDNVKEDPVNTIEFNCMEDGCEITYQGLEAVRIALFQK